MSRACVGCGCAEVEDRSVECFAVEESRSCPREEDVFGGGNESVFDADLVEGCWDD